jgi:hypothetical protein
VKFGVDGRLTEGSLSESCELPNAPRDTVDAAASVANRAPTLLTVAALADVDPNPAQAVAAKTALTSQRYIRRARPLASSELTRSSPRPHRSVHTGSQRLVDGGHDRLACDIFLVLKLFDVDS